MSLVGPIQPAPSPDRSYREAEELAQRDLARLLHGHSPAWGIDRQCGTVVWMCSCNSPGPYNAAALDTHILAAVRKARGPVRGPQKR